MHAFSASVPLPPVEPCFAASTALPPAPVAFAPPPPPVFEASALRPLPKPKVLFASVRRIRVRRCGSTHGHIVQLRSELASDFTDFLEAVSKAFTSRCRCVFSAGGVELGFTDTSRLGEDDLVYFTSGEPFTPLGSGRKQHIRVHAHVDGSAGQKQKHGWIINGEMVYSFHWSCCDPKGSTFGIEDIPGCQDLDFDAAMRIQVIQSQQVCQTDHPALNDARKPDLGGSDRDIITLAVSMLYGLPRGANGDSDIDVPAAIQVLELAAARSNCAIALGLRALALWNNGSLRNAPDSRQYACLCLARQATIEHSGGSLSALAHSGDMLAQFVLGRLLLEGAFPGSVGPNEDSNDDAWFLPPNLERARYWLHLASSASQFHPAILALGMCLAKQGHLDDAERLIKESADAGFAPSQHQLGLLLEERLDFKSAEVPSWIMGYFKRASDRGYPPALTRMAQWNFQQDKVLSALGLSMIILASSSDSAAQTCLGDIYLRGDATTGVCRDPKKAFEFFEMAALAGDVKACSALGWMHVQSKSALSGEVFLTLAAQKGDVCAMRNLGMLLDVQTRNYSQGEPDYAINRKLEYAVSLLRVAAFGNDHAACFHLAKLCEEGRGCHEDLGEALLWYRKAAADIPEAAFRAGLLMMRGVGPYGLEEGQQWVNQAQSLNPRLAITQT